MSSGSKATFVVLSIQNAALAFSFAVIATFAAGCGGAHTGTSTTDPVQNSATPSISPGSGSYTKGQTVHISDATAGAIIYYTTDGTTPTTASAKYSAAISVTATETIQAIAVAAGYSNSAVASAKFVVATPVAVPAFSLPAGNYKSAQSVTLSDATAEATIYYTTDGSAPTTASPEYSGPISVGASEVIEAIAVASGYTSSGLARADYVIQVPSTPSGPSVPSNAIIVTELQLHSGWKHNHDPGTSGTSAGSMTIVTAPAMSEKAAEFASSFQDWGGEIYHVSFGTDSEATNFVYDAEIWFAEGSKVGNLDLDMNQVMSNGDTVIYGFQCDGDHGTWDYSGIKKANEGTKTGWFHSTEACNPADWTTDTWHHVQISYSRDEAGNATYHSVWLDGVEAVIDATVPSASSLGWAKGDLLTNFQIDGRGSDGASVVYADKLTISRW